MDVSSSWKGGKALIYTHRFPGIFIGLAKCHYTAGGEVMNCNKLWCGWVCVSCHWLINRNTVTSLKRSTMLPPAVIFFKCIQFTYPSLWAEIWTCSRYKHVHTYTHTQHTYGNKRIIQIRLQICFPSWQRVWTVNSGGWNSLNLLYPLACQELLIPLQSPWICSNMQPMQQIDPSY